MNEEKLKELGLEGEVITKILALHKESIDGNYIPKATFDAERENVKTLKNQISERDTQITELSKFKGTNEDLQKQIEEYKTKNEELKANSEKEIANLKKENILKFELKNQVIDVDDVLPKLNMDNIVFENDTIKSGLKEQLDDLRKTKPHYFAQSESTKNTGWKPFGSEPNDSNKNTPSESPDVAYARSLATAKNNSMQIAQKASDIYFK